MSKVRSITEHYGLRVSVESYVTPKGPLQCKRCQRFENTRRNCGYAPRCVVCGAFHFSGGCSTPREQQQCCGCGVNHSKLQGLYQVERSVGSPSKSRARGCPKKVLTQATPLLLKNSGLGPLRADGSGRGLESRRPRGRVVKATTKS